MSSPTISEIAVVGAGVIGRGWARVFIRAGCHTTLYDPDADQSDRTVEWIRKEVELDQQDGAIDKSGYEAQLGCLTPCSDLPEALAQARYVQESGPERINDKKAIFTDLDRYAKRETILCSSTSALNMTQIAAGLAGARRCMVAHPVNPPHIIPLVELVPGKDTDPAVVVIAREFLASVGQTPVVLRSHIPGFLLNRLQAAIFREAIYLVESDVADLKDIEAVVSEGLGLRWALLGPLGVADANVDDGLRENFRRYRQTFLELMNDLGPASTLPEDLVERLSCEMNRISGGVPRAEIRRWRDRMLRKIRALKAADPRP